MKKFKIIRYDEGGIIRSKKNRMNVRLVCVTDQDEIIAIWGTDTEDYQNINNVIAVNKEIISKGFPCSIKGTTKDPANWAKTEYSHNYWIEEDEHLEIV